VGQSFEDKLLSSINEYRLDSGLHQLLQPFGSLMLMSELQTNYMSEYHLLNQSSFDDRVYDCDLTGFDVGEVISIVEDSRVYTEDELIEEIMIQWKSNPKTMDVILNSDYFYGGITSVVKDSVYTITEDEWGDINEWIFEDVMYLTLSVSN
jgi:hypothetical protein